MSGYCDFCQVWHSGSCCHPGRHRVADLEAKLGASQYHATPHSEVAALRARVRELEEAVEAARASAIREAVAALPRSPLFSGVDMVSIDGWHIQRPDLLAALLPAPAPGRDTTTGGTDAA